jgi:hypothetical protein
MRGNFYAWTLFLNQNVLRLVMILSTRKIFRQGEPNWDSYINWIGLPQLQEIRTIDAALNSYTTDGEDEVCTLATLANALQHIPKPSLETEYYLLAINTREEPIPARIPNFEFLGCDLTDETRTSSILNCGRWEGALLPYVKKLNQYGLLDFSDARLVQDLLPKEWGDAEPHAYVDIWALFGGKNP